MSNVVEFSTGGHDQVRKMAPIESKRHEAILEEVSDIVAEVNADKVYTWMNRAGLQFFGEDAVGTNAACYFEGEQETLKRVQPVFEGDPHIVSVESWQRRRDGQKRLLAWRCRSVVDDHGTVAGAVSTARDITEQFRTEASHQLARRILEISNHNVVREPMLREIVSELQAFTGCQAIGVRLLDKDGNIPYEAYAGFSEDFYRRESPLSIASDQCMCINVIKGATDPKLPFYTPGGSFYMNGTTRFLATVSEEDKGRTRNVCNQVGYESVALIPIRCTADIIGAIHLADHRENLVPLHIVEAVETIGVQMGASIRRVQAEEALHESESWFRDLYESVQVGVIVQHADGTIIHCNRAASEILQMPPSEVESRTSLSPHWQMVLEDGTPVAGEDHPSMVTLRTGRAIRGAIRGLFCDDPKRKRWLLINTEPHFKAGETTAREVIITFQDITALRQTEETLRESEQRFRALFENDLDAVLLTVPDGTILAANPAACRMFGRAEEEICRLGRLAIVDGSDPRLAAALQERASTGKFQGELTGLRRDGTKFPVEIASSVFQDRSGQPRTSLVIRDITEHNRAEEAVRRSEERLRLAAEAAEFGTYVYDFVSGRSYCSPEFLALFGLPSDAAFEHGPAEILKALHPEDRMAFLDSMRAANDPSGEGVFDLEYRILLPGGQTRWLRGRGRTAFGVSGSGRRPLQARGIVQDITSRKRLEEALLKSEEKYRLLVEGSLVGIGISMGDRIIYANQSLMRMCGYENFKEYAARPFLDYFTPASRASIADWRQRARRGEKVPNVTESDIVRKDGTIRTVQVCVSVVPGEDGVYAHCTFIDITERKQAETALRESEEKYRLVFSQERDAILLTDADSLEFLDVNEAALRLYGYSRAEFLTMKATDLSHEPDHSRITLKQGAEVGGVHVPLRWHRKEDGTVFPVEISAGPFTWNGRNVICSIARDITERRRAEESLRESEDRFRQVAEAAGEWIWEVDADGLYTYTNSVVEDILGYQPEEIVGQMHFYDFCAPQVRDEFKQATFAAFARKEPIRHLVNRNCRKNGEEVILMTSGLPVVDAHGHLLGYRGTDTDITRSKRLEEEQRESEAGLAAAQQLAHVGSWRWTIATDTASWSDETYRIFGLSGEPLRQHRLDFLSLIVPEDRERVDQALTDALAGARDYDLNYRIRRPDGEERIIHAHAQVVRASDGRPILMHGTIQDITEREQAAEALRQANQRMALHVRQTPLAVIEFDLSGRVREWNPAAAVIFGFSREEAIGQYWHFVVPESVREQVDHVWEAVVSQRGGSRSTNENRTKDGRMICCEWFNTSLADANGQTIGVASLVQDVTEQRQAEEAIRESKLRLEAAVRASNTGLWDWNLKTNKVTYSREWKQQLGYEEWEISNDFAEWQSRVHPDDVNRATTTVTAFIEAPRPDFEMEFRLRHKDGSYRWILTRASLVHDGNGAPIRMLGSHVDITHRKRMETALRESEQRYRTIFEQAGDYVMVLEPGSDGVPVIVDANESALRMHQYSRKELLGQPITLLDPELTPEMNAERRRVACEGRDLVTGRHRCKDGTFFDVEMRPRIIRVGKRDLYLTIERDITDRKRAEEKLRQSEERLSSILRAAPIGLGVTVNRIIKDINPGLLRMTGYTREELIDHSGRVLYPDDEEFERVGRDKYAQIRQFGCGTVETKWKRKDGALIDVVLSSAVIDPNDPAAGVTFTALDITEHKRADMLIRASEEKYSKAFEACPEAIVITSLEDGRYIEVNDVFLKATGFRKDEVVGHSSDEVGFWVHASDRDRYIEGLARRGFLRDFQVPYRMRDGEVRECSISGAVFELGGKRCSLNFIVDITERKRAEEEISLLKHSIDVNPDGAYWFDSDNRLIYVNDAGCTALGWPREELIGRTLYELVPGVTPERAKHVWDELRKKGFFNSETIHRRKDGSEFPVEILSTLVRFAGREYNCGFARDITVRKRREGELQLHRRQLRTLVSELVLAEERERRRIATNLHDNACQSIVLARMKLQPLLETAGDGELHEVDRYLGEVLTQVRDLTFSLGSPTLYRFGLETALEEMLDDRIQARHGIECSFSDDKQFKPLSDDTRVLLFRSVGELLMNVVKHAKAHKVSLDIRRIADSIEIVVADDGIGCPVDEVFSSPLHNRHFGLLSIRERLEHIGGCLRAESQLGCGSKFILLAPLDAKALETGRNSDAMHDSAGR
jgi:PAS domain S-box-containing protein